MCSSKQCSHDDIHIESTKLKEFENKKIWSNIELHLLQVCDEYRKVAITINITRSLLVPAMSDAYVCIVQKRGAISRAFTKSPV